MNIGTDIKKLRRERDITQEQLAEYLNISVSAISQWECGKTTPDISLLAPLANIFGVSADVLLGIDVTNKEKQIQNIIGNAEQYHLADPEKAVSMLREGLKEYPNSFEIMERLMNCLYSLYTKKHGQATEEALMLTNEIIKLGEKILAECTDDKCRSSAINSLCFAYSSPEAGMTEKAIELAEKLPYNVVTREGLLAHLYEGEKQLKLLRDNIQKYFATLMSNTSRLSEKFYGGGEKGEKESEECDVCKIEEAIVVNKKIIALIEIMIEDENYGFFGNIMAFSCLDLARDHAKLNDYDKAIEYLRRAADNVIKMDTEYTDFTEYTSLLLKGTTQFMRFVPGVKFATTLLERMKHTAFDPIRERRAFIEIEEKIKKYEK